MEYSDSVKLLRECDAGSKMAVSGIEDVLEHVKNKELLRVLEESRKHHEKLGNEIHEMLNKQGMDEKDPPLIAKGMSHVKTNFKITMDSSDATIAELMVDGCDMGIKSLYQYLHQYKAAEHGAKDICERLIGIERGLRKELYSYL